MIPKIIHQTYKNHDIPEKILPIITDLRQKNPSWEYRFYDDDTINAYLNQHADTRTRKAYARLHPKCGAARADLFRYIVLYHEGGVYFDIKSTCVYPLDEVIHPDDTFIITQWQNEIGQKNAGTGLFSKIFTPLGIAGGEYQQWAIACERHSPIMRHVIERVVENILSYRAWHYGFFSYGKRGVLAVTGPIAYTLAVHEVAHKHGARFLRYDKDMGFLYSALIDGQSHTKMLANHYAQHKGPVVDQGRWLNFLSSVYIFFVRLSKSALKSLGLFKE